MCLIPGPFGTCICSSAVEVSAVFNGVSGANTVYLSELDFRYQAGLTSYSFNGTASLESSQIVLSGTAGVQGGACGLHGYVYGSAYAQFQMIGSVSIQGTASYNFPSSACVRDMQF